MTKGRIITAIAVIGIFTFAASGYLLFCIKADRNNKAINDLLAISAEHEFLEKCQAHDISHIKSVAHGDILYEGKIEGKAGIWYITHSFSSNPGSPGYSYYHYRSGFLQYLDYSGKVIP